MIVLVWNLRRIAFELVAPGVSVVHIYCVAIAVEFPHAGHGHHTPVFVVKSLFPEIHGSVGGVVYPVEFPEPIEAEIVLRFRPFILCKSFLSLCESEVLGAHRSTVYCIHFGILPLGKCLAVGRCCGNCECCRKYFYSHIIDKSKIVFHQGKAAATASLRVGPAKLSKKKEKWNLRQLRYRSAEYKNEAPPSRRKRRRRLKACMMFSISGRR